jgi:two-component system, NarL family, invasion response regulator UvrY
LNVLIATPGPEFRQLIATLLRVNFDIGVIGETDNGADAVRLLVADAWEVAILGVRLPVGGGLHFLHQFKAVRPGLPVVMVCFASYAVAVRPCLDSGANGYVMGDALAQELVPSVRTALAGEVYPSAAVVALNQA